MSGIFISLFAERDVCCQQDTSFSQKDWINIFAPKRVSCKFFLFRYEWHQGCCPLCLHTPHTKEEEENCPSRTPCKPFHFFVGAVRISVKLVYYIFHTCTDLYYINICFSELMSKIGFTIYAVGSLYKL